MCFSEIIATNSMLILSRSTVWHQGCGNLGGRVGSAKVANESEVLGWVTRQWKKRIETDVILNVYGML